MSALTLMLTPVLPSPTGGGSLMRAAATLECLAARGPVIVVQAECWGPTPDVADRSWARDRAAAVVVIQPHRLHELPAVLGDTLASAGRGMSLDAIHVFRQVMAPIGLRCRELFRPRVTLLDLDDDEDDLDAFLVSMRRALGEDAVAARLEAGRHRRRLVRGMMLAMFDRVFLSNPADVRRLRERHPRVSIAPLPNVVPQVRPPRDDARERTSLLFLGTLSYFPNEDGVAWFIRDILPRIRAAAPGMRLRIVGAGTPEMPARLVAEGVDLVGQVPDVGPEHARAGQLVVPLRAGSGTRIKILEAFRHGTPVVSTPVGAAGLGVAHGEHVLLAESPEDFARSCLLLATDADRRRRLADRAAEWVERHHSIRVMGDRLAEALAGGAS